MKNELYISVDIESDGPAPGLNSMLSVGAVAFTLDEGGKALVVDKFYDKLLPLPDAKPDPDTLNWWHDESRIAAYDEVRRGAREAETVTMDFYRWLSRLKREFGKPVFIAHPAGFDFTFVYWYLHKFAGDSPFSFSALDIKTLAWSVLPLKFHETSKKAMPKEWFKNVGRHDHNALHDAEGQMELFAAIMWEISERRATEVS